jgi:hypothetical protein
VPIKVSFEDLQTGMVLAAPLTDAGGRLLLPAGTALTEKHLRYFQMWGIPEADIEGGDHPAERDAEAALDPVRVAQATDEARLQFRHADLDHPVLGQLFRHCVLVAARRRRG